MKRPLAALALLLLPAANMAEAATATAALRIDNSSLAGALVVTDAASATASQLGVAGLLDFGVDEAFADADVASATLRFLARDGRQVSGTAERPEVRRDNLVSAAAMISETLNFSHNPALGPLEYSISLEFTATPEPFLGTFGQVSTTPRLPFGGESSVVTTFFLELAETFALPGGGSLTNRSSGSAQQRLVANSTLLGPNGPVSTVVSGPFDRTEENIGVTLPAGASSAVTSVRSVIQTSAERTFSGFIDIAFIVDSSLDIAITGRATGIAIGVPGVFAATSSLNTGRFGVTLPEGGSFTSGSGLFLTATNGVTPVPLPAPALLLVSGLALLAARARRPAA